jgi:uncharacterized protein (DUF2147 family)
MNRILILIATLLLAAPASAQSLEGLWANPKRSVIVKVERCGPAYCGTVNWASDKNKEKGVALGTRVLSDLKPNGDGSYRGSALEPKRNIRGSATVHQLGPNVMVVRGCALLGILCKDQRWTRVTG